MADSSVRDLYANDSVDFDDSFDTGRVGDEVVRIALQAETPFTLGVVGKWGSGKTSVLRRAFATFGGQGVQIEVPFASEKRESDAWNHLSHESSRRADLFGDLVDGLKQSVPIWFSPWQHQQAANPLLPLLLEIRDQYSVLAKARGVARNAALAGATLLERVIDGGVALAGGSSPGLTGTTEALRNAWTGATAETRLDDGQRFHLLFADAVETVLQSLGPATDERDSTSDSAPAGRLVIFVDDLDRCEEDAIVQLLEAIKLYLGATGCVFVLGLDEAAVLSALNRHWQGRSEDDNREYLEKLFQATVPVPLPSPPRVEGWVRARLGDHGFENAEACATLVVEILEPNPRKVKNFVNSVGAVWRLLGGGCPSDDQRERFEERFILLQYLRLFHKPIWRLLERDPRVLRIVIAVLHQKPIADVQVEADIDSDFDPGEQSILIKFIFERFSHVLGHGPDTREPSQEELRDRHGHMPLGQALKMLEDRLDRKRPDQKFRLHFTRLFEDAKPLPDAFLYLPEIDPEAASETEADDP